MILIAYTLLVLLCIALYTEPNAPWPMGYNNVKRSSGLLGIDKTSQNSSLFYL